MTEINTEPTTDEPEVLDVVKVFLKQTVHTDKEKVETHFGVATLDEDKPLIYSAVLCLVQHLEQNEPNIYNELKKRMNKKFDA